MTTTGLLQLAGTLSLIAMVAYSARLITGHWWCRYGKELTIIWMFLGACLATLRLLDVPFQLLDAPASRTIAGGVYLTCLIATLDVSLAHIIWHRRRGRRHMARS